MTKTHTLVVMLLTLNLACFAQKKSKTKTHTVKIEKYEVLDSLNFNIGKLIDKRPFKENIGMAQTGAFNKKAIAILPDSLHTYIEPILHKIVPAKPEQKTFDVYVYDLAILEHTGSLKETGYCKLQIELVKDNLSYGFYGANIQNNGMDVTNGHGKRIMKAFAQCFKDFNTVVLDKKGLPYIDIDDIEFEFPEKLPVGAYSSFNAIIRGIPDILPNFNLKKVGSKKLDRYALKDNESNTFKTRKLLYSDGENIYLHASNYSFDNHYLKAKHTGRYIYFEDRFSDPATAAGVGAAMGVAFGLAGGVVGALATNIKHAIVLDTKTGIVTVLNSKTIETLLHDNPSLLSKYQKSKKDTLMKELIIIELNKQNS